MDAIESINKASINGADLHPKALEPATLVVLLLVAVLGAVVGIQLIVTLGISANTSIIGAMLAIIVSRVPVAAMLRFRSIHRQNLVQTAISSATFGAGNSLFIPIGVPYAMGHPELIFPMLCGATLGMIFDAVMLYRLFDTKIFPASGTWPAGVATAEAIFAGDQGGKKAGVLGIGLLCGMGGSFAGIPMSAFGVAFIGNMWALSMFGCGLLLRFYSKPLFEVDINKLYIPHGIMIGAGLVALIQVFLTIINRRKAQTKEIAKQHLTVSDTQMTKALGQGFVGYLTISVIVALLTGIGTEMSWPMLLGFLIYAAVAAYIHELIVGIAAMYSGWFPALAVALITLVIGIVIGFPAPALGVLVGLSACTGPAFADMGYDLKAGYILRGNGENPQFELEGRRQQMIAGMVGFFVATLCVWLVYENYFARNLFPPIDKVYAASIAAGVSTEITRNLAIWAIPGALMQLAGGSSRQLGVLLATGLLISVPLAGWAVIAGLVIRYLIVRKYGETGQTYCNTLAGGMIAGDALLGFFKPIVTGTFFKIK